MIVTLGRVLEHILQIADEFPVRARRDGRLMHVQSIGKSGLDIFQADIRPGQKDRATVMGSILNLGFPT